MISLSTVRRLSLLADRSRPAGTMGSRRRSSVRNQLLGPEREEPEEVQPYAVCGRFKVDWAGLCEELGLAFVPEVVARPCPPYLMEQAQKKAKVSARKVSARRGECSDSKPRFPASFDLRV